MVSVQFIEIGPGMNNMATLRVVSTEKAIEFDVPSAFVAIAPEHDARMIDVAGQHFADKLCPCRSIVSILPACQFVNVEQPQRVAGIQKVCIGGIMGTDGIHIHFFDELHVLYAEFLICGSSTVRMEGVAVDAFHDKLGTVQIESVAGTEVDGTETDTGGHGMNGLGSFFIHQGNGKVIKIGSLRCPGTNTVPTGSQGLH